jgi:hypothetical protein
MSILIGATLSLRNTWYSSMPVVTAGGLQLTVTDLDAATYTAVTPVGASSRGRVALVLELEELEVVSVEPDPLVGVTVGDVGVGFVVGVVAVGVVVAPVVAEPLVAGSLTDGETDVGVVGD